MQIARPAFAAHPLRFGRGRVREGVSSEQPRQQLSADDLKLFATTFAAGFLFVSILIA